MRLHLGCGKKILPGYVNCDFAPVWGGKPDLCFDLLDTWPIEDGSASEVLAVHVWEHFYEWEHPHLVSEARRVLKPGGLIALEMPDLRKCCANLLRRDPWDDSNKTAQNDYWGIYADPTAADKDPKQMHHSGWWPQKLILFLEAHGFENATEAKLQHKGRRTQRDMRVEAWRI